MESTHATNESRGLLDFALAQSIVARRLGEVTNNYLGWEGVKNAIRIGALVGEACPLVPAFLVDLGFAKLERGQSVIYSEAPSLLDRITETLKTNPKGLLILDLFKRFIVGVLSVVGMIFDPFMAAAGAIVLGTLSLIPVGVCTALAYIRSKNKEIEIPVHYGSNVLDGFSIDDRIPIDGEIDL